MNIETFKAQCKLDCESWSWSEENEMLIFCKLFQVDDRSVLDDIFFDEELQQPEDVALLVTLDNKRSLKVEIHILYSIIWEGPDLYLQASWTDTGEILEIDRFCSLINKPVPKLLSKRLHPRNNIPFYNLHPCHSQDLMLKGRSPNIFLTWLTAVNQMLDLVPMVDMGTILKAYPK